MDSKLYIEMLCTEGDVYWRPTFCASCSKPKIIHAAAARGCTRTKITQLLRTKYELACNSNPVMGVAAKILTAKVREERAAQAQHQGPPTSSA